MPILKYLLRFNSDWIRICSAATTAGSLAGTHQSNRRTCSAEDISQSHQRPVYIGVDIGKTSIKAACIQGKHIMKWQSVPAVAEQGSEALITQAEDLVSQLMSSSPGTSVAGVGVAITGVADVGTGLWYGSTSVPGAAKIAIGPRFETAFGVPTFVENDVNCAALGEAKFGSIQTHSVGVLLIVASGIKFCVVRDGRLDAGAHLLAGHVAHLPLWRDDRTLFETASGMGIAATAQKRGLGSLSAKDMFDLSLAGNAVAAQLESDAIEALGALVSWIQLSLDPTIIVIGGGVIDGQRKHDILGKIKLAAQRNVQKVRVLPELKLEYWSLGADAGIIGAAALCAQRLSKSARL